MVVFVVEHLEEEFYKWCEYEYLNMSRIVGGDRLLLTNFAHPLDREGNVLWRDVRTDVRSIVDMDISLDRICLLDSESDQTLAPEDAAAFDYFLFGGILGNVDEFDFDRTSVLRVCGFPTRNLGSMQMTTDTAVRVSKMILCDKMSFAAIPFVDRPEFEVVGEESAVCESPSLSSPQPTSQRLVMNFRYVQGEDGQPLICPQILALLRADCEFCMDDLE